MYSEGGGFLGGMSFLKGWYSALEVPPEERNDEMSDYHEFWRFRRWLAERLGYPNHPTVFRSLDLEFGSDATRQCLLLYAEFRASEGRPPGDQVTWFLSEQET